MPPDASELHTSEAGSSSTTRVVLAEDNALLRAGLARLLESDPSVEVVGTAGDLDELLERARSLRPDVVITDIRMPPTSTDEGIRAATVLGNERPELGIVVLSQYANPSYAIALLEAGSSGRAYLLKDRVADAGELVRAVRAVAAGGSVITPEVVDQMLRARRPADDPVSTLTIREREVLELIATGASNAGISSQLKLSERAVEKHVSNVFVKLRLDDAPDINRRVRAVLVYMARG
ncbi:MAG: response regulator [Acidimicrobiia bacterium]